LTTYQRKIYKKLHTLTKIKMYFRGSGKWSIAKSIAIVLQYWLGK